MSDQQRQDAYDWWKENQERDFDNMTPHELYECCKEQDKLYMLAFPNPIILPTHYNEDS